MATKKKGMLAVSKEWCKHLRHSRYGRIFWKTHRKAEKKEIRDSLRSKWWLTQ